MNGKLLEQQRSHFHSCQYIEAVQKIFPEATVAGVKGDMRQKLSNAVKTLKRRTMRVPTNRNFKLADVSAADGSDNQCCNTPLAWLHARPIDLFLHRYQNRIACNWFSLNCSLLR